MTRSTDPVRDPGARQTLACTRDAASRCQACDLWERATQTVFGEGPVPAELMLVGEQPGDHEDIEGRPFVGPAGRVLDEALVAVGIDRADVYVTNAVKHFRWTSKGRRRIHDRPNRGQVGACRPWLDAEIFFVRPKALVLMGAVAAQSLLGPAFKLTEHRCEFQPFPGVPLVLATIHPSAVLRAPDGEARREAMTGFVGDLRFVARRLRRAA